MSVRVWERSCEGCGRTMTGRGKEVPRCIDCIEYKTVAAGEWVQPRRRNYYMKCCDCGLVHRMNFRIRKGRIQMQAFRLRKRTT